jgi:phosphoglycolate phosphatase
MSACDPHLGPVERALIFDFDGVLADSLEIFEACVQAACRETGVPSPADRAAFLRLFDGNMFAGLRQVGVRENDMPALIAALRRHLESRAVECRLWPGMAGVLARLSETSAIFVVTSGIASVVAGVLQRHGVTGVRRILGAEEGTSKVAKIRVAALACPGANIYYVGDTCGDMLEGREAGACTIAAAWGWHDAVRLRATQPDHLLHTPAELTALFVKGKGKIA